MSKRVRKVTKTQKLGIVREASMTEEIEDTSVPEIAAGEFKMLPPAEVELDTLKIGEWFEFRDTKYRKGGNEEDFAIVINPKLPSPRRTLGLKTKVKLLK